MRGHSLHLQGLATTHPGTLADVSDIFPSDLRETQYPASVSRGEASEHLLRNSLKTIPSNSRGDSFLSTLSASRGPGVCKPFIIDSPCQISRGSKEKPRPKPRLYPACSEVSRKSFHPTFQLFAGSHRSKLRRLRFSSLAHRLHRRNIDQVNIRHLLQVSHKRAQILVS